MLKQQLFILVLLFNFSFAFHANAEPETKSACGDSTILYGKGFADAWWMLSNGAVGAGVTGVSTSLVMSAMARGEFESLDGGVLKFWFLHSMARWQGVAFATFGALGSVMQVTNFIVQRCDNQLTKEPLAAIDTAASSAQVGVGVTMLTMGLYAAKAELDAGESNAPVIRTLRNFLLFGGSLVTVLGVPNLATSFVALYE